MLLPVFGSVKTVMVVQGVVILLKCNANDVVIWVAESPLGAEWHSGSAPGHQKSGSSQSGGGTFLRGDLLSSLLSPPAPSPDLRLTVAVGPQL